LQISLPICNLKFGKEDNKMFEYILAGYLVVDLAFLLLGLVTMVRRHASAAMVVAATLVWPLALLRLMITQTRAVVGELVRIARGTLEEIGRAL